MRKGLVFALLGTVVGVQSAVASVIGLDTVFVTNPTIPIAGDAFDDNNFDAPPWFVVSGTPGPESGTTLTMRGGDYIALLGLAVNPAIDTGIFAQMDLTDFPAGSSVALIAFGDEPGELLSLGLVPGAAFLADGIGNVLGADVVPASSTANFLIHLGADGTVIASVDGVVVANLASSFGPLTGVGIQVVPEPATLCLFGLGCVMMGVRRRLNRARD